MSSRVWGRSQDNKIVYETLSSKYLPGVLEIIRSSFCINETLCRVIEICKCQKAMDQLEYFLREIAEDGVSVVAVEKATDKVLGVAFNKILEKENPTFILDKFMGNLQNDPIFTELLRFYIQLEGSMDLFKHYKISSVLDLMFLAVHNLYYGRHIGTGLVNASAELAKALSKEESAAVVISEENYPCKANSPPRTEAIMALFTSSVPQRIGKSLGWDEILVTKYNNLFFGGESYGSKLESNNQKCVFMAHKI